LNLDFHGRANAPPVFRPKAADPDRLWKTKDEVQKLVRPNLPWTNGSGLNPKRWDGCSKKGTCSHSAAGEIPEDPQTSTDFNRICRNPLS
jgi:hypothetical protein